MNRRVLAWVEQRCIGMMARARAEAAEKGKPSIAYARFPFYRHGAYLTLELDIICDLMAAEDRCGPREYTVEVRLDGEVGSTTPLTWGKAREAAKSLAGTMLRQYDCSERAGARREKWELTGALQVSERLAAKEARALGQVAQQAEAPPTRRL